MSVVDSVFLYEIGLIIVAAAVISIALKKFKQPPVLSYVLAGILIGPFGLSLVSRGSDVFALSELGIAFLLFGTAVKIDLNKLKGLGSVIVATGVIQVAVTFGLGYFTALFLGLGFVPAVYLGLIIAFSSTMIVIKVLADSYRLNTLYGRMAIGILVIQDLLVVVAIALLSSLTSGVSSSSMLMILLNGFGLFSIALVANRLIFPYLLGFISDSKELLFLASISTCFIFMGLADFFGFSIALGAFIAGLSLSAFRYNLEIGGKILPLRDFFSTMFFVTLGMQLNLALGLQAWLLALALIVIILVVKPLVTMVVCWFEGYGRAGIETALTLAQASEFSFIIAATGLSLGHLNNDLFSVITVVTITTMLATPYFINNLNGIIKFFTRKSKFMGVPLGGYLGRQTRELESSKDKARKEHLVLLGCHRMGRQILDAVAKKYDVVVLDYDPDVVEELRKEGFDVVYGDVFNSGVLKVLNFKDARIVVSTIPDPDAAVRVIKKVRAENKDVVIYARASTLDESLLLYEHGADIVLQPESLAGRKASQYLLEIGFNKRKLALKRAKHLLNLEEDIKHEAVRRLRQILFKRFKIAKRRSSKK